MNDLGRMVLNLMLTFVPWSYGKMFYVYSNDTATILNAKKEEEKWLMENSKLRKCLF
jgi:hypothetical protein